MSGCSTFVGLNGIQPQRCSRVWKPVASDDGYNSLIVSHSCTVQWACLPDMVLEMILQLLEANELASVRTACRCGLSATRSIEVHCGLLQLE